MEMDDELADQFFNKYWPDYDKMEEQLHNPTSEYVITCYQRLREIISTLLYEATGEKVAAPSQSPLLEIDSMCDLLNYINIFLRHHSTQGIDCTLTLTDLYSPTAKRTKTKVRILTNILMVFYTNLEEVRSAIESNRQLSKQVTLTQKKFEQLQSKLAESAENLAKLQDEDENLSKRFELIETEYNNLHDHQEDSDRDCGKLQQELKTSIDIYQNKQMLVKNLKASISNCNEQIVNVDTYKSLEDLKQNLCKKHANIKEEVNYTGESLSFKKPDLDHFNIIHEKIEKLGTVSSLSHSLVQDIAIVESDTNLHQVKCSENVNLIKATKESILKTNTNIQEINMAAQSELEQHIRTVQEIYAEIDQINLPIDQEKDHQKKLLKRKDNVEMIILEGEKALMEKRSLQKGIKEFSSRMYEKIISAENPVITNFVETLTILKSINSASKIE